MCELLTAELVKYYAHSALTSQFICRAMGHLASGCLPNVELFIACGAVEGLVATLNRQASNEDVICDCCWAIRNMVTVDAARDRLMNAKGVETIISVLTTGRYMQGSTHNHHYNMLHKSLL